MREFYLFPPLFPPKILPDKVSRQKTFEKTIKRDTLNLKFQCTMAQHCAKKLYHNYPLTLTGPNQWKWDKQKLQETLKRQSPSWRVCPIKAIYIAKCNALYCCCFHQNGPYANSFYEFQCPWNVVCCHMLCHRVCI